MGISIEPCSMLIWTIFFFGPASSGRTGAARRTDAMIIPVRCFTCGKVTAQHWEEYVHRVAAGEDPATVLTHLGYARYCCRRMFLTNVDLTNTVKGNATYT